MNLKLHADTETFSEADLKAVGAARYAYDPSTEILCCAFALGDEEPHVWKQGEVLPQRYRQAMVNPEVECWAHHAQFERFIFSALAEKTWGIPAPAIPRYRCTMSMARRASLPASLEKLGEVLELKVQKDARGKALIRKFSMLPTRATKANPTMARIRPQDDPKAFQEFCDYCATDVKVEVLVAKKLAYFNDSINNANYTLDQVINARGVPVNLAALRHAQLLIEEETELVTQEFHRRFGFMPTQDAVFKAWLKKNGCPLPNLKKETVEEFLDNCEGESDPRTALQMKQSIAYAATKKVKTMLACAGPMDNRMRGLLQHHGAGTGRWTHGLVQPGNMKRSTKHSEAAYRDICKGISRFEMEIVYGPPLEVMSGAIRHFLQDGEKNIFDGDYSGVEARIVNWLAGQEDALEGFRAYDRATGEAKEALDPYRIMAAEVYNIPLKEVQKFPHRFVGKGVELGAGFMLSPAGFRRQCLAQAKYDLAPGQEYEAIGKWRKKHHKVVRWWKDLDNAGKSALLHPGQAYRAGKIVFCAKTIEGTLFLLMKLPSGRNIAYPRPKIIPGKFAGTTQIAYYGNIKGQLWGECRLWPGVMANNSTQGTANDVMFVGCHNCERESYQIFNVIHDQALAFIQPGQTVKRFSELLTTMPDWASGLPLASEAAEAPFYRKS